MAIGIRHVQDYIQFVMAKGRQDIHAHGEPMSSSTVKRYATVFRSILSVAYKLEYIDEDISASRRLVFPKNDRKEVECYTMEEVGQILEALKEEPLSIRTIIQVALFTGCRRGEIVGLKWSDIDLNRGTLTVRRSIYKPKNGKTYEKEPKTLHSYRTISIPATLCDTLREYKASQDAYINLIMNRIPFHRFLLFFWRSRTYCRYSGSRCRSVEEHFCRAFSPVHR